MERIAFYFLLVVLVFLPIPLGSNRAWAWSLFEISIAFVTLLSIWSIPTADIWERVKKHGVILGLFALAQLYVAIQLISIGDVQISVDPAQTKISLLKGICYCLFVFCTLVLLNSTKRLKRFVLTIIVAVFLQALYAIYLQFSGLLVTPIFGYEIYERANGSFVYHNHLANYLLVGGALAIGLLISQLKRPQRRSDSFKRVIIGFMEAIMSSKWLIRVAIVTIVVALILTRSRMANSAFFISLLATAILALFIMKKAPPMLKWLIISLVVIDVSIVGAMFGIDKVKERIDTTSLQGETRDDVVTMSVPIIEDYWLTGTGAGTFYTIFPKYHTDTIHLHYDHAHNEYLQFFIEYGIFGVLLLGGSIIYALFKAMSALKNRSDPMSQGLAFASIMGIVGMLIHISVDFPLQAPATTINFIALMILGVICGTRRSRKKLER
jgi:O-antigen ligase